MRRWVAMLGLSCVAVGLAVLLTPTPKGWELLLAVNDVDAILKMPGARSEYADISMSPSRYSIANIFGNDVAAWYLQNNGGAGDARLQRALIDGHGPDAAQAISIGLGRECLVVASAEAIDRDGSPVRLLAESMPSKRLTWDYVLLHESAHCFSNVALVAERRLKAAGAGDDLGYGTREYRLAKYAGEAYADAYAVMMLYRRAPEEADEIARLVANWRSSTNPIGSTHRTFASIACAASSAQAQQGSAPVFEFGPLHRRAVSCAVRGAAYWMEEQGIGKDEQERRLAWLSGMFDLPEPGNNGSVARVFH